MKKYTKEEALHLLDSFQFAVRNSDLNDHLKDPTIIGTYKALCIELLINGISYYGEVLEIKTKEFEARKKIVEEKP